MAINQVGNITRNYSTAGVSSTTSSSRTMAISSNTSSTRTSSSTTGTTIKLSSATAKANSSTTMSYSGASSTAKVSSTTASTTGKASSTTASTTGKVSSTTASTTGKVSSTTASTTGKVSSTTASTTAKVSSTTASVVNRVTSSTGASIATSTRVSATSKVSSTTASTTSYPYLSHMGGEALNRANTILVDLGYKGNFEEELISFRDDIGLSEYTTHSYEVTTELFELGEKIDSISKVLKKRGFLEGDTTVKDALVEFRNSMGLVESGIYDEKVIAEIDKLVDYYRTNGDFDIQLRELGFLNPESGEIDPMSVKANSAPSSIDKSIENFCRVYGIDDGTADVDAIMFKIEEVYSYYKNVLNSPKTARMFEALGEAKGQLVESQKINFCKSLTFLELGMKFKDESGEELSDDKKDALISGILANWCEEGFFSETNAQDGSKYWGIDNSDDYTYDVVDEIGFGIMQWTNSKRKQHLVDRATEMESGVGNINTQFALVMYEVETAGYESNQWSLAISQVDEGLKGVELARKYAVNYYNKVERGRAPSEEQRAAYAEIIYKGLVEKYE